MPVISPVNQGDIEVTLSLGLQSATPIIQGSLVVINGQIVHLPLVGPEFGNVHGVTRSGDSFVLGATDVSVNQPATENVYGANLVVLDNVVVAHRADAVGDGLDDFVALTVATGTWGSVQNPLATTTGLTTATPAMQRYKMARLNGTHLAIVGTQGQAAGWQPQIFMVEYNAGTFADYGPFAFGGTSGIAGNHPTSSTILVRLDGQRLLAVWWDKAELDFSNTTYMYARRPFHAQVLTYDTTAHTITAAGPVRHFSAGVEDDDVCVKWYPEAQVLLIVAAGYGRTGNLNVSSVRPNTFDGHIAARSLIVDGTDVTEGSAAVRVAEMLRLTNNGEDYWYGWSMVAAGDRVFVVYPDVTDLGGDLRYCKFQVGLTGTERGAIGDPYADAILVDGGATDFEMWGGMSRQIELADGSLTFFEHYVDTYSQMAYRFLLAQEVP